MNKLGSFPAFGDNNSQPIISRGLAIDALNCGNILEGRGAMLLGRARHAPALDRGLSDFTVSLAMTQVTQSSVLQNVHGNMIERTF